MIFQQITYYGSTDYKRASTVLALFLCSLVAYAQSSGRPSVSASLLSIDVQTATVSGSTPATYLNMIVDASTGLDIIDVCSSSPQVQISLVLPSGVEITPANASAMGFNASEHVINSSAPAASGAFTPFDSPGSHTTFNLPAGSATGTYKVKANSTNVSTATTLSAMYISLSGVAVGLAKTKSVYSVGENVVLTAAVFRGTNPVINAIVTASVIPPPGTADKGTPSNVTMPDSGPNDAHAGDGLYTGVYTPTAAGSYQVLATITGTFNGAAFRRIATTTFEVMR